MSPELGESWKRNSQIREQRRLQGGMGGGLGVEESIVCGGGGDNS